MYVCLYACKCMCVCIYVSMCMCNQKSMYVCMYANLCMSACMATYVYKSLKLSLGFRVGKFGASGLPNIIFIFYFFHPIFTFNQV